MADLSATVENATDTSAVSTLGGTLGGTLGERKGHSEAIKANNVRYYQDQNRETMHLLANLEEERDAKHAEIAKWNEWKAQVEIEHQKVAQELAAVAEECKISTAKIAERDTHISTLSMQNRELLDYLGEQEKLCKEKEDTVKDLSGKQMRLQKISDEYDKIKDTGNRQLASAFAEIAKYEEELRNAANECEQLKDADATFQQQAKADIEELEKKLRAAKDKNVEHLQQIQHNEVHEHRLGEGLVKLKEMLDELSFQKKGIRMQLDVDVEHRDKWQQSKAEVEKRRDTLEKTVEALRMSLRSAEEHNQKMQQDNKHGADNFRQLGDKVYSLMDQLRVNQRELKQQEAAGIDKSKRINVLDKQANTLQQDLQAEVDAKLQAEAEARGAAQMQALLQKKNKMLEEALQLALKAQEKVEKRLAELKEKANSLQTQNEYLGTRIEGNEEDKGALKYELRRLEEELRQTTSVHTQLAQHRIELEDKANDLEAEKAAVAAELEYIKREDMLDETGRTKPILIESESKLIDRLQINEFLFSAQQTKNPVKMLVEKISHLLELLHTAQTQSDLYLQDLQRSNSMLTALRGKNMALYEKVQLCETWKMRALLKIVSNAFEARQNVKGHVQAKHRGEVLYLDGLQYTNKELKELVRVVQSYEKMEVVKSIRLQDNSLAKPSVPCLIEILNLCPYLNELNLNRNKLDEDAITELQTFVERIPGVTAVTRDPVKGDIVAKSGHQLRLTVKLEHQEPVDETEAADPTEGDDLMNDPSGAQADAFLASASGVSSQTKLQGPAAKGYPPGAGGTSRTLLSEQKGGLGASLPKIPGAAPRS